jgi:hypothetical protein
MDEAYTKSDTKAKTEISKSAKQQEQQDTDNCSPFCTCNCCTGFSFVSAPYQVAHPVLLAAQKVSFHLPAKISNIALPIWQPPQLG